MLSVFLLSCVTYHFILDFFFSGTDTLTLVETSRVNSFDDMLRLFSEPLMAGTGFVEIAKFYRPLTALSYSLDYAVWNLNPWGFQLTNLLLNALVAGLTVLVLYELSERDVSFAWLSGIIFAIHPILVESVPATDRRQDMLAAVFLLLTLALFMRYRRAGGSKKLPIFLSVLSYVLALGAKEVAIIVPPLVFARVFLFSGTEGLRKRFLFACSESAAYVLVSIPYLVWRTHVLGGIGGYLGTEPRPFREVMDYAVNIVCGYVTDLIYPADLFGVQDGPLGDWWTLLIAALVAGYVSICVLRCGNWNETDDNSRCKALVLFLLVWLLLPLLIFVATLTFAHRSMYIPAIPFSALVAYPMVQSLRSLVSFLSGLGDGLPVHSRSWLPLRGSRATVAAIGCALSLYILAYSPLVRSYGQWEDSARIAFLVLTQLASEMPGASQDYQLAVYDLPDRITSYDKKTAKAKEVTYLRDYSIKSWLSLCHPSRPGEVVVRSRSWPCEFSGSLSLGIVRLSRRSLVAFVKLGASVEQSNVIRR
jgi:hypothetical protein